MKDLHIALVQTMQLWENPEGNRIHFEERIARIATRPHHSSGSSPHIIFLPEMFTTGFTMNTKVAEHFDEENMTTLNWMRSMAAQKNSVVAGSVAVEDGGKFFNRLLWVRPDGSFEQYDKRHLFSMAHEDNHYTPGKSILVVSCEGWKICPLICYDLRFPVWSRNKLVSGIPLYDVLTYVASWPSPRIHAWKTLLPARAIENSCYTAGLSRTGADAMGLEYTGDSLVCDFKGNTLAHSNNDEVIECVLSWNELEEYRKKFPVLRDGDGFEVEV
ncbi:MAG: amidohydrolase [Flavobacteriales bacterium]|nr:amidohydrolase [Flavobacteriales bacterium]